MAKLKGMPIKRILITHGEKIVLGTIGLIVLIALGTTSWAGIDKQPEELLTKATAAAAALHTGAWPEDRQAAFKPSTYQATALSMFEELNVPGEMSPYAYNKPMSFPIYQREEPRGEPEWPGVQHLIADADKMVLGIMPPLPTEEELAAEQEALAQADPGAKGAAKGAGAKAASGKGAGKAGSKKGELDAAMPAGPGMMGGMEMASTGLTPRGQRYVAVRGIVNLFDIGLAIQKALHLETLAEGMALVEVYDFKLQRQKAVAGPNPWQDDQWQDVSLDRADEVLMESGQAADLIITECIDPVYTMPLPTRLDGDYTKIVSHPALEKFELTKEQRELEQKLNMEFLSEAEKLGIQEGQRPRRGFVKDQIDINEIRSGVIGAGGNTGDIYKRAGFPAAGAAGAMPMMPAAGMRGMPGGMPGGMGPRAGMPGAGMPAATRPPMAGGRMPAGGAMAPMMPHAAGGPGMGAMPGMGPGMQGGMVQQVGMQAAGYLMLFRYLDFDVNPGEAYRYRVKLEFTNPNYGMSLDKIKEASVAEGETRFSEWSEPSAPVVVGSDTKLFLTDLDKRNRSRGEARIRMFQWDPSLGTYIDSKLVAKFGQFLGGLATSWRLDLGTPSLAEKQVLFASKSFLIDTAVPPAILPSESPDLNLVVDAKQAKDGLDLPDEAIVLDEYGQLKVLDSALDKPNVSTVEKQVEAERTPWEYLKESEQPATGALDDPMAGAMPGMPGMPGMGGPKSALKRGGRGGGRAGAMGPMGPMGMDEMMPGGARGTGRGGKGGRGAR